TERFMPDDLARAMRRAMLRECSKQLDRNKTGYVAGRNSREPIPRGASDRDRWIRERRRNRKPVCTDNVCRHCKRRDV
ncbi:MAG: hypothetical protein WCD38_06300, partial [Candidatus Tumulicola sp.]